METYSTVLGKLSAFVFPEENNIRLFRNTLLNDHLIPAVGGAMDKQKDNKSGGEIQNIFKTRSLVVR